MQNQSMTDFILDPQLVDFHCSRLKPGTLALIGSISNRWLQPWLCHTPHSNISSIPHLHIYLKMLVVITFAVRYAERHIRWVLRSIRHNNWSRQLSWRLRNQAVNIMYHNIPCVTFITIPQDNNNNKLCIWSEGPPPQCQLSMVMQLLYFAVIVVFASNIFHRKILRQTVSA